MILFQILKQPAVKEEKEIEERTMIPHMKKAVGKDESDEKRWYKPGNHYVERVVLRSDRTGPAEQSILGVQGVI